MLRIAFAFGVEKFCFLFFVVLSLLGLERKVGNTWRLSEFRGQAMDAEK